MKIDNVQNIDKNVQRLYNELTRGMDMIETTISEFRQNLKKYEKLVKEDDILVYSNGNAVMKIEDPNKNKREAVKRLKNIIENNKSNVSKNIDVDKDYYEYQMKKAYGKDWKKYAEKYQDDGYHRFR